MIDTAVRKSPVSVLAARRGQQRGMVDGILRNTCEPRLSFHRDHLLEECDWTFYRDAYLAAYASARKSTR